MLCQNFIQIPADNLLKEHKINQIKEVYLLILGIIFLLLSRIINNESIWKEILLITGSVPIWEVVDIALFSNTTSKGKRTIIKKIIYWGYFFILCYT